MESMDPVIVDISISTPRLATRTRGVAMPSATGPRAEQSQRLPA